MKRFKKQHTLGSEEELLDLEEIISSIDFDIEKDEIVRDIYIFEEITRPLARSIVQSIRDINEFDDKLEKDDKEYVREPINIFIDTYGGEVSAGFSIITAIKMSKTIINGIVTGNCYSMGVPILVSCDHSYSTTYSLFMIHSISCSRIEGTSVRNYYDQMESLESHQRLLKTLFSREVEGQDDFFEKILDGDKDYYLESDEAIKVGIIESTEYELSVDKNKKDISEKRNTSRKWKAKATK